MRPRAKWHAYPWLSLLIFALAADLASAAERAKTDIITLQNGDRITGRILYAEYGILQVNSGQAGGLSIEMVLVGGRRRTVDQFRELAGEAGLEVVAAGQQPGGYFVVECRATS